MKRRFMNALVYVTILSLCLSPTFAYGKPMAQDPTEKGGKGCVARDITKELNLTPEQNQQLKAQRQQTRQTARELQEKIRTKRGELREALDKKDVDRNAVNKIIADLKELQGSMLEQRVDSILKMKTILTPEQFTKLQSLHKPGMRKGQKDQKGPRGRGWRGSRGQPCPQGETLEE
jgi:Spy/CpxP family protein refolding chaperone